MRISSLRVDGYGLFCDHLIEDLPPGLSVLYGPNEAGKSTLLDFLRGVLFGFADRRSRARFHEPLRGGRHGGALGLVDDKGERYLLERHVGARAPRLFDAGGRAGEPAELAHLLGGADEALFDNVFAFGLAELARFESLDRDEVRDVVFSAGVLGAGRSATRAQRSLREREDALVRRRQQDAVANRLAARLAELEEQLRGARSEARDYPSARAAFESLETRLSLARAELEARRVRIAELERLLGCAPARARRDDAARQLAACGPLDPSLVAALERQALIEGLSAGLSGYEEQCATRERLATSRSRIEAELADHLRAAGDIGLAEAQSAVLSPGQRERADELATERAGLTEALRALEDALRDEQGREDAARESLDAADEEVRAAAELDDLALDLSQLRKNAAERARLRLEIDTARREQRLAAAEERRRRTAPRALGIVACALAVVLAGACGWGFAAHHRVLGVLAAAGSLAALVTASFSTRAARDDAGATAPLDRAGEDELARLVEEATAPAARLGVHPDSSASELEALAERLAREREERRRLDQLAGGLTEATRRREQAERAISARRARLEDVERAAASIVREIGVELATGPEGLSRAIDHLNQAQALINSRETVSRGLAREVGRVEEYLRDVDVCAGAVLGLDHVPELEVRGRVSELAERLSVAQRARARFAALEQTIGDADRDLVAALGSLEAVAAGAQNEEEWRLELEHLRAQAQEGADALEELVTVHHDAGRHLEELSRSDRIAELELEAAGATAELEAALSHFAALHLARTMIQETLARFERERQPVVIARAAELFSQVTGGRYCSLVARESPDGRRHGVVAIDARGPQIDAGDLSTGTAEQLYLCLRIAFAETFARSAVCLPLVFDDVLVNFDPTRAAAVARVVAEVARSHQVLAFTCHPEIVEIFSSAADAHLVPLGGGQAS